MSYLVAVRSLGVMTLIQVLTEHASLAITVVHDDHDQPVQPAEGDMNCIVGSPFDPNADTKLTSMEFWYGVETTVNNSSNFDYPVESKIYNVRCSDSLHFVKKPKFSSFAHCMFSLSRQRHRQYLGATNITEGGEFVRKERLSSLTGMVATWESWRSIPDQMTCSSSTVSNFTNYSLTVSHSICLTYKALQSLVHRRKRILTTFASFFKAV